MITLSIDVTKLDKSRFKRIAKKSGESAVYADLVMFETQSEYGDYIVKQQVTKEERAAKLEMPILGNGKIWDSNKPKRQRSTDEYSQPDAPTKPPF